MPKSISTPWSTGIWRGDALYLVGSRSVDRSLQPSVLVLRDGQWQALASPTALGFLNESPAAVLAFETAAQSGPQPTEYLEPESEAWRLAPNRTLLETTSGLVALSATPDNPEDGAFSGAALRDGTWFALNDAPFTNRMLPGLAVVGDLVVVVGGAEGSVLTAMSDIWILDLSEQGAGEDE
jgi:hypothetical protein